MSKLNSGYHAQKNARELAELRPVNRATDYRALRLENERRTARAAQLRSGEKS